MFYKTEKNILSTITKNKFKGSSAPLGEEAVDESWGCYSCNNCTLCKNYLVESKTITAPNTNQTFKIKSTILCSTKNVIYLLRDKVCDIIYVGYTSGDMKQRWAGHKSHIKTRVKSCEISSHFIAHQNSKHKIDRTGSQSAYTESLAEHLEVLIIESVTFDDSEHDHISKLEARETFWQNALKGTVKLGGINKRTNKRKK